MTEVWGYADDEFAEQWHGHYKTRLLAQEAALEELDDQQDVWVCKGELVTTDKAIDAACSRFMEDIVEQMDEWAGKDCAAEDVVFTLRESIEAETNLKIVLKAWAKIYVATSGYWTCTESPILVRKGK